MYTILHQIRRNTTAIEQKHSSWLTVFLKPESKEAVKEEGLCIDEWCRECDNQNCIRDSGFLRIGSISSLFGWRHSFLELENRRNCDLMHASKHWYYACIFDFVNIISISRKICWLETNMLEASRLWDVQFESCECTPCFSLFLSILIDMSPI